MKIIQCLICNSTFSGNPRRLYCSPKCARKANYLRQQADPKSWAKKLAADKKYRAENKTKIAEYFSRRWQEPERREANKRAKDKVRVALK